MELSHLRAFIVAHRAGGFAAAADALGVAPSSVSRAVAALEAELGARLFHRTTRRVTLTEAGAAFLARAEPALGELEAAALAAGDATRGPSGLLRVTTSVAFGELVIAPRLDAFLEACPDVRLDLILSDAAVDLVAQGVDLAVRHGRLTDSSLVARKLTDVAYRVVASPAYLADAAPITAPQDLTHHPCLTFSYEGFRDSWRFRREGEEARVPIAPIAAMTNAGALLAAAKTHIGPALLADWTVADAVANGSLVDVLPDWEAAGGSFEAALWLVRPGGDYTPEKVRAFTAFLDDVCV